MRLNMENSTVYNYPKGTGATRHFPNMTSPKAREVLDVTLRNGTCFIEF